MGFQPFSLFLNVKHFLSEDIPEDVADRFYKGELTLTDIQDNPELAEKIEEKELKSHSYNGV